MKAFFSSFKTTLFSLFFLLIATAGWGQATQPTAQALPYVQNFSSFTGGTTTYPAGMQGWDVSGSLSVNYPTSAPTGNRTLAAGNNSTQTRGVYDMNGKVGIASTSSAVSTFALAINTTSLTSINVSYKAGTQYSVGRINELGLQYRVGTSGNFTNVSGAIYQNTGAANSGIGTTAINVQTVGVTLPVAAENKAVVQLRWIARDVSGTGNRTVFSIDDISVTSIAPVISVSDNGTQIAAGDVQQATPNHILSTFKIAVTDANTTLKTAYFTTKGNYKAADITNFKLWRTTGSIFSSAVQVGVPFATSIANGVGETITFDDINNEINKDVTAYYWITTDIKAGAAVGRTIGIEAVNDSEALLEFANGVEFTGSASAAGLQTITVNSTPSFVVDNIANTAFGNTCINKTSSNTGSFKILGIFLTGNIVVGPLDGYTFSTDNTVYNSELTLSPDGSGNLAETTVYIQFRPIAVKSYSGNIPVSGGGAPAINVSVTGSGINTAPAIDATPSQSAITSTTAVLGGTVSNVGCSAITERGIYYSTTAGFANGAGTKVSETGVFSTGAFTTNVASLSSNTTYYFKAFVTSLAGTVYTSQGTFTTAQLPAPVALDATSETTTGFTANWEAVEGAISYELDVYQITTGSIATDLFISEYVEGSSNNKYIEIFNGTGNDVNLSDYELRLYANGGSTPNNPDNVLVGTLANGATIVYRNSLATKYSGAATDNSALNFNGDDAVALYKISTTAYVDIFGRIGNDPGTQWTAAGGYSTFDKTLVRKSNVTGGVTVSPTGIGPAAFTTLGTEWDLYDIDTVSDLGSHTFSGGSTITYAVTNQNVGNVLLYNVTGLDPDTQYFYVVRAVNGKSSPNSNEISVTTKHDTTTYNGSAENAWDFGLPTAELNAVINGAYVTEGNLVSKTLTINAGNTLTIAENTSFTLGNFTNNGTLVVESDGNFVQTEGSTNTGAGSATVKRNATMKRLDYTYWGSPVSGQMLKAFSPNTVNSRFLTYNESDDTFTAVVSPATTAFAPGKGYAIRADNTYPAWTDMASAVYTNFIGSFTGKPNNGDVPFTLEKSGLGQGFNLVANPYASNIDLDDLLETGVIEGTVYFWSNVNKNISGTTYEANNYANYAKLSGGTVATNGTKKPERYIKVGQGFIVQAKQTGTLTFTNAMRDDGTGASTYMNKGTSVNNAPIDRFWLKLTTPTQNFNTLLIAYPQGATNGFESSADAQQFRESSDSFYTILNDFKLNIQGRQFPLVKTDVVQVGMKGFEGGNYTISMVEQEGVFAETQMVYLKDNQTNTITNLSVENYSFAANEGLTEGRFEIVYENEIVLGAGSTKKDELIVYRDGTDFIIKSIAKKVTEVEVYDTSGRLVSKFNPNQTEIKIDGSTMINGVYILKINRNGELNTKKITK